MGCVSFIFISMIIIGFNLLIEPTSFINPTQSLLRGHNYRNINKKELGPNFEIDSIQLSNVDTKLNDDYCDHNDGSDETQTSACSHILVHQKLFQCDQKTKTIYMSRVNDYVCDCKDGSDEVNTIKCY